MISIIVSLFHLLFTGGPRECSTCVAYALTPPPSSSSSCGGGAAGPSVSVHDDPTRRGSAAAPADRRPAVGAQSPAAAGAAPTATESPHAAPGSTVHARTHTHTHICTSTYICALELVHPRVTSQIPFLEEL